VTRRGIPSTLWGDRPPSPVRTVTSFIECINRGDSEGLGRLMTEHHRLQVFDEPPLAGRDANIAAWSDYLSSFPEYRIHAHRIVGHGGRVAVLGHTTGSHLNLSPDEEQRLTIIWLAEIGDGKVLTWSLVEDTPDWRRELGLGGG
jgi:limonene-1,2-epoxide hydrolase